MTTYIALSVNKYQEPCESVRDSLIMSMDGADQQRKKREDAWEKLKVGHQIQLLCSH